MLGVIHSQNTLIHGPSGSRSLSAVSVEYELQVNIIHMSCKRNQCLEINNKQETELQSQIWPTKSCSHQQLDLVLQNIL